MLLAIQHVYQSNQKYEIQLTLINLNPNEYSQELHFYPIVVKLDKCARSCNALNELSNKLWFQIKQKVLNICL